MKKNHSSRELSYCTWTGRSDPDMDCTHYVETINWQTFESVQTTNKNNMTKNPLAQKYIIKHLRSNKEASAGSLWTDSFKSLAVLLGFVTCLVELRKAPGSQINASFRENLGSYAMILGMWSGNLEYPQHSLKFGGRKQGFFIFLSCKLWRSSGFSHNGSCGCYRWAIRNITAVVQMQSRSAGELGWVSGGIWRCGLRKKGQHFPQPDLGNKAQSTS